MFDIIIPEDHHLHSCKIECGTVRYFKAKSTIWFLTDDVHEALGWGNDLDDFSEEIYRLAGEFDIDFNEPHDSQTYIGNLPLRTPVIHITMLLDRLATTLEVACQSDSDDMVPPTPSHAIEPNIPM